MAMVLVWFGGFFWLLFLFLFCFYFLFFQGRISLRSPGCSGIGSVNQASLEGVLFKDVVQKPHTFIGRNKHKANSVLGVPLECIVVSINKQSNSCPEAPKY